MPRALETPHASALGLRRVGVLAAGRLRERGLCAICISARRCTTRSRATSSKRSSGSTPSSASIAASTSRARLAVLHLGEAEFSVGDFELNYRMHHRAGRAITAVLEGAVDEVVRNDAAFRLARIHFQKGQLEDALHALDRISGEVPDEIARRHRVPAREHLHGARPPRRSRRGAEAAAERGRPEGICGLQPRASRCSRTIGEQDALEQLDRAGQVAA